jgi:hypothetical protein
LKNIIFSKWTYGVLAVVVVLIIFFIDNPFTMIRDKIKGASEKQKEELFKKELAKFFPQQKSTPTPWSNEVLADSFFAKGKKEVSFSAKINDKLPEFNFKIVGSFIKHPPYISFLPQYIEIINPSNKEQQKLYAKDRFDNWGRGWSSTFDFELANIVELVDINFDGYLDLRLLYNTGATGNNWYATYLFNPSTGKFVSHEELSELSGLEIDQGAKQIITYDRDAYCNEVRSYYKVVNNKLVLSKAEWSEYFNYRKKDFSGGGCFMYTGSPRHAGIKINPRRYLYPQHYKDGGQSYMRKIMKDIKEEPLDGSLDRRARGLGGNPIK